MEISKVKDLYLAQPITGFYEISSEPQPMQFGTESPFSYVSQDFIKTFGDCDLGSNRQIRFPGDRLTFRSLYDISKGSLVNKHFCFATSMTDTNIVHLPESFGDKIIVIDLTKTRDTKMWCLYLAKKKAFLQDYHDELKRKEHENKTKRRPNFVEAINMFRLEV